MSNTYSFMAVKAGMVGPGLAVNLGDGASVSEEGVEINPAGDKSGMQVGADGEGLHSLYADKSGQILVHLLKNSPTNEVLSLAYAFQTASPASHGQNTFTLVDKVRGDAVTATGVAFKKAPPLKYAKDADIVTWEFDAIKIERVLGS